MVNPLRPFRAAITRNTKVPQTTGDIRYASDVRTVVDKDLLRGDPGRELIDFFENVRPSDPQSSQAPRGDDPVTPEDPLRRVASKAGDDIDRSRFRGATLMHDVRGNPDTPNVNDIVRSAESVATRVGNPGLVKVTSPETWVVYQGDRPFRFSTRTGEVRSPDLDTEPLRRRIEPFESDPEVDERRLNELVGPTVGTTGALLAEQEGDSTRLGAIARKLTSR
jgi:hypothetical protein